MKSAVSVRAWQPADAARLARLELSRATLRDRFWGGVSRLPPSYLAGIAARWPLDWDAVVAERSGALVGWAEFGRNDGTASADVAVCVVDSERGHGTGTALLLGLLQQSATAGLAVAYADIAADNLPALRTWQRASRGMSATLGSGASGLRGTIRLPVAAPLAGASLAGASLAGVVGMVDVAGRAGADGLARVAAA